MGWQELPGGCICLYHPYAGSEQFILQLFRHRSPHQVIFSSPSQRAMTAEARQLPVTFTAVRPMSISASIPMMMKMGSGGSPNEATVPDRITSDARGTPATPLLVSMSVNT